VRDDRNASKGLSQEDTILTNYSKISIYSDYVLTDFDRQKYFHSIKILLVEDIPINRKITGNQLKQLGYRENLSVANNLTTRRSLDNGKCR
jgi:hypothetical protein